MPPNTPKSALTSHGLLLVHSRPEEWASQALIIGRQHACILGLANDDREDCAMEFVHKMLTRTPPPLATPAEVDAWLHRCARNHTCNFQRALRIRSRHHSPSVAFSDHEEGCASACLSDFAASPLHQLLLQDFWAQIERFLSPIRPQVLTLFVRFYKEGWSVQELATHTGRTPNAVEQSLARTRARLRARLTAEASTAALWEQYMAEARPSNVSPAIQSSARNPAKTPKKL
jgi:RNA polymerase sigma factor (sigma-70 family)